MQEGNSKHSNIIYIYITILNLCVVTGTTLQCTLWRSESQWQPALMCCLGSGCCRVCWSPLLWPTRIMWSSETRVWPSVRSSGWARSPSDWCTPTARCYWPTFCLYLQSASLTSASPSNSATAWPPDTKRATRPRPSGRASGRSSDWCLWWWRRSESAGCPSTCSTSCVTSTSTSSTSAISCWSSCCVICALWARPAATRSCTPGSTTVSAQSCARCSPATVASAYRPTTAPRPASCCDATRGFRKAENTKRYLRSINGPRNVNTINWLGQYR